MRRVIREDHPVLNEWLSRHGMAPLSPDVLPNIGFIVEGVAVGFVYLTDSSVALMDNFLTNPAASPTERHEAITAIGLRLIEEAQRLGHSRVIFYAGADEMKDRGTLHGFHAAGRYDLMIMEA